MSWSRSRAATSSGALRSILEEVQPHTDRRDRLDRIVVDVVGDALAFLFLRHDHVSEEPPAMVVGGSEDLDRAVQDRSSPCGPR